MFIEIAFRPVGWSGSQHSADFERFKG